MRQFIKKLREIPKGTRRPLTEQEQAELEEFVEHKGHWIIKTAIGLNVVQGSPGGHEIDIPLTEQDAVQIYKMFRPHTFSRKTPLEERYPKRRRRR